jgi:hypothetical protein
MHVNELFAELEAMLREDGYTEENIVIEKLAEVKTAVEMEGYRANCNRND